MSEMKLSWDVGIDHISSDTNRPEGAVVDAVNVDIDRAGNISRRIGHIQLNASPSHSVWSNYDKSRTYGVFAGILNRIVYDAGLDDFVYTALYHLNTNIPLSYDELNDGVVFCNREELSILDANDSVRRVGLEMPGTTAVAVTGVGGLDAGRYGVATSYIRNGEEGTLSPAAFVNVAQDGGITVNLTQPNESLPTGIRIYRTTCNGETLLRAADVPLALSTWTLGAGPLGRPAETQFKVRMPGGNIVRYWRGRLLVARGTRIIFSDPLNYGITSERENFIQLPRRVTMMRPVEGGIFVGTADDLKFYSGSGPNDMTVKETGGMPPVAGSDTLVSAEEFGDIGIKGKPVAIWLATNGFIVGMPDGTLVSKQSDRIRLPSGASGTGAIAVNNRQAVAVIA